MSAFLCIMLGILVGFYFAMINNNYEDKYNKKKRKEDERDLRN